MLIIFIVTTVVVLLTVGVHYEMLRGLSVTIPRLPVANRARVGITILGALVAHLVEVMVFALAFYLTIRSGNLGELKGGGQHPVDIMYFSLVTYTSLGYGDITPAGNIRLLAGVEALTGLVLIAWTASFAFLQMQRFWTDA